MAQVSNIKIWYPDGYPGPAYDLSKIIDWGDDTNDPDNYVQVRFIDNLETPRRFLRSLFIARYTLYADIVNAPPGEIINNYSTYFSGAQHSNLEEAIWPSTFIFPGMEANGAFSVSAWAYSTNPSGDRGFWGTRDATNPQIKMGHFGGNWNIRFGNSGSVTTAIAVQDSVWAHVVFTRDTLGNTNLYVDTVGTASATQNTLAVPGDLCIGHGHNAGQREWRGNVDELSFWSKELSPAEVAEIYNSGTPNNLYDVSASANLVGWYRLGDGDTYPNMYNIAPFAAPIVIMNGNMSQDSFQTVVP